MFGRAAQLLFGIAAFCVAFAVARADEPWKPCSVKDGVELERREVSGSSYYEYRVQALSTAPPPKVLDAIWSGVTLEARPNVHKRVVLKQTDRELVMYQQLEAPVVSDRDVTLRIWKVPASEPGVLEVRFATANELGPPPDPSYVRLPMVRGNWRVEPAPSGGSKITYTCYSEPGGSIAAFMVRGTQQDNALVDVKRVLLRLR